MVSGSRIGLILLWLCFCTQQLQSIEYQPWIGNFLEFEFRTKAFFQHYDEIASQSRLHRFGSDDGFLTLSLSNALSDISLELEATLAATKKQEGDVDNFRLHGRYVWLNDVAGEDFSLTTGLVFTKCFKHSLHDISSFHHALGEVEGYVTLGREETCELHWISRWWVLGGIGTGIERGALWLRANAEYEWRIGDPHEWGVFVHSLWGCGHRRLHPHHFDGYGPVQHQSVDVGLRYTYLIPYFGHFSAEYRYRPYARNFPAYTQQIVLSLLYTFGL